MIGIDRLAAFRAVVGSRSCRPADSARQNRSAAGSILAGDDASRSLRMLEGLARLLQVRARHEHSCSSTNDPDHFRRSAAASSGFVVAEL